MQRISDASALDMSTHTRSLARTVFLVTCAVVGAGAFKRHHKHENARLHAKTHDHRAFAHKHDEDVKTKNVINALETTHLRSVVRHSREKMKKAFEINLHQYYDDSNTETALITDVGESPTKRSLLSIAGGDDDVPLLEPGVYTDRNFRHAIANDNNASLVDQRTLYVVVGDTSANSVLESVSLCMALDNRSSRLLEERQTCDTEDDVSVIVCTLYRSIGDERDTDDTRSTECYESTAGTGNRRLPLEHDIQEHVHFRVLGDEESLPLEPGQVAFSLRARAFTTHRQLIDVRLRPDPLDSSKRASSAQKRGARLAFTFSLSVDCPYTQHFSSSTATCESHDAAPAIVDSVAKGFFIALLVVAALVVVVCVCTVGYQHRVLLGSRYRIVMKNSARSRVSADKRHQSTKKCTNDDKRGERDEASASSPVSRRASATLIGALQERYGQQVGDVHEFKRHGPAARLKCMSAKSRPAEQQFKHYVEMTADRSISDLESQGVRFIDDTRSLGEKNE